MERVKQGEVAAVDHVKRLETNDGKWLLMIVKAMVVVDQMLVHHQPQAPYPVPLPLRVGVIVLQQDVGVVAVVHQDLRCCQEEEEEEADPWAPWEGEGEGWRGQTRKGNDEVGVAGEEEHGQDT